ncbi:MAG TPA: beta-N-acetylglucosaminidase domain-containing protein [Bacteroidales bacterium]|nr:beta-N-acetylglucosaminidase domain-containing protein [Bacteroidales bacterium]
MSIKNVILRFTLCQIIFCLALPPVWSQPEVTASFRVTLPDTIIQLPYHIEKGISPGFKIRGIKGYAWTPEQYLAEIPTLVAGKANFLMNCYLSMFSTREKPHYKYGTFLDSIENRWWSPLPSEIKAEWIRVINACAENNINFCFSMNPQLFSDRPLQTDSDDDFELLLKHYEWAQQNGVRWFSLCLDDLDEKMVEIEGRKHALLANRLFEALRANDKEASFAFCPTWYWGTGSDPVHRLYLEALAATLYPEVYVFWTGPHIVPVKIATAEALEFRNIVKHRIILWDNYPVNDNHPAIHLGPLTGRDRDLCKVIDGYMSNSLGAQSDINSIPVLTSMDYAYNPDEYDPDRSIGQVIAGVTPDRAAQMVLARLVETYPGSLILAGNKSAKGKVGLNPVRDNLMGLLTSGAQPGIVEDYINQQQLLLKELRGSFPDRYQSVINFLKNDIRWMREQQSNFLEAFSEVVNRSPSLQASPANQRNSEGIQALQVTHGPDDLLYSSSGKDTIQCPDTPADNTKGSPEPIVAEIISVEKIWDKAPHNAFTGLIRYKGRWYCAFRESTKHVYGTNGKIRVLTSRDGKKWKSAALLESEGIDLRDPSFVITPDDNLMLHIGASIYEGEKHMGYKPAVVFTENGRKWSDFYYLNFSNKWPWHPFCDGKEIYVVAYGGGPSLYKSRDGKQYELICDFKLENFVNEAAILQKDNDTLMALIRRDGGNRQALIGKAASPFTEWQWKECGHYVGGPAMVSLPDGRVMAGGRSYIGGEAKTVIGAVTDLGFNPVLILPGGGDCSYPGMVWHEDMLVVSYYSSHEGKSSIYIARIRVNESDQDKKERESE